MDQQSKNPDLYGIKQTTPLGQVPTGYQEENPADFYDQSFGKALGMLGDKAQLGEYQTKIGTGAEGQLWQGIAQQQAQSQAQASRRGFSPLAARGAGYAGGELESAGYGTAAKIRAGEEAARQQALLNLYQQRSKLDMAQAAQETAALAGQQQYLNALAAFEAQKQAQESGSTWGTLGNIAGAIGQGVAIAGMMGSDENMKTGITDNPGAADATLGSLGDGGIQQIYQNIYGSVPPELQDIAAAPEAAAPVAELSPFEQMIAANRGKAVPAPARLANAGEAIGAARQAANERAAANRAMDTQYGFTMEELPGGGPAEPMVTYGTATPIVKPIATGADVADARGAQIAEALKGTDADMMRKLTEPVGTAAESAKKAADAKAAQIAEALKGTEADYQSKMAAPVATPAEAAKLEADTKAVEIAKALGQTDRAMLEKLTAPVGERAPTSEEIKARALEDASKRGDSAAMARLGAPMPGQAVQLVPKTSPDVNPALALREYRDTQRANQYLQALNQTQNLAKAVAKDTPELDAQEIASGLDQMAEQFRKQIQEQGDVDLSVLQNFADEYGNKIRSRAPKMPDPQAIPSVPDTRLNLLQMPSQFTPGQVELMRSSVRPVGRFSPQELDRTTARIRPVTYQYKPGFGDSGTQLGITAQQLEQTPAGRQMVVDTPIGKMVDTTKATGPMLAMLGRIDERLRKLEG